MNEILRRGDIVLIDFDPTRANEVNKRRPAVIITNNLANLHGSSIVVVPLSSNIQNVYPFQLLINLERSSLDFDSKAQVELLRSVSISRVIKQIGHLPEDLMTELDNLLKLHLGLN